MHPDAAVAIPELYRRMARIRGFEERVSRLYAEGMIPGFVHLSIGQEAAAVGACWPLGPQDVITSNHRGHGHCLAKGLAPTPMFAELMARETGINSGHAGSMHLCDPGLGIFGANGIVGAGLPIAAGAAYAMSLQARDNVVVAFFGDGAVATGAFHEAVNLAALWELPVVFFCENNHYSEFSPARGQHPATLSARASGYGLPFSQVDGNDVVAVATQMTDIVAIIRAGGGAHIVEADTYRWHGHYEGDPMRYRGPGELETWQARDPLLVLRRRCAEFWVATDLLDDIDAEIESELNAAVETARRGAHPRPSDLHRFVITPRLALAEQAVSDTGETYRYMDAIHDALEHELAHDPDVFLAGIDIGAGGNVFALTRGLVDAFPGRVCDTPISETAIVGLAVGAAMAGLRPVVEIMYLDFIGVCLDQIMNQAAKLQYMTGGAARMSLVIRTQFGAGRSSGSQHSQSLEALLAHIPGLTVLMPSTPADAYGMLRAAIQDPNPVVFIEHRHLYGLRGPKPSAQHLVPIGSAAVRRAGNDITLVASAKMVHTSLSAAEAVAAEGLDVEVVDLRSIVPWDVLTVTASVRKTGRLIVVHEAVTDFGIGAEIVATVAERELSALKCAPVRVGAPATPPPYAPDLERVWLPSVDRLTCALRSVMTEPLPASHQHA